VVAGSGHDTLEAYSGNNTVSGGSGNDSIVAGSGNNVLYGGSGNDTIVGGSGSNYIAGLGGNDSLVAGSGTAVFGFASFDGSGQATLGNFQHGRDFIYLIGYGISNITQLTINQVGPNTTISTSPTSPVNEIITLPNTTASTFTNSDFIFA
jgi:Ca2+-binding RTX toxin-like protein